MAQSLSAILCTRPSESGNPCCAVSVNAQHVGSRPAFLQPNVAGAFLDEAGVPEGYRPRLGDIGRCMHDNGRSKHAFAISRHGRREMAYERDRFTFSQRRRVDLFANR